MLHLGGISILRWQTTFIKNSEYLLSHNIDRKTATLRIPQRVLYSRMALVWLHILPPTTGTSNQHQGKDTCYPVGKQSHPRIDSVDAPPISEPMQPFLLCSTSVSWGFFQVPFVLCDFCHGGINNHLPVSEHQQQTRETIASKSSLVN